MIEQQARVSRLTDGKATVTMASVSGCPACDAGQGCGAGVFGRLLRRRPISVEVDAVDGLAEGQAVTVGIPESLFLRLLARMYLLPLLAGLAGAVAGNFLAHRFAWQGASADLLALLGALILFISTLRFLSMRRDGSVPETQVLLLRSFQAGAATNPAQHCQRPAS